MPVIEITSLAHPGVDVFSTLTEAQLRNRIDPQRGIFIAESPKVIRVALEAGYEPVSLLCERKQTFLQQRPKDATEKRKPSRFERQPELLLALSCLPNLWN